MRVRVLPLLPAVMLLVSCAFLDRVMDRGGRPEPGVEELRRGIDVREELRGLLKRREYPEALRLIKEELEKGMPESYFIDEYPAVMNGLIEAAERLFRKEAYKDAGLLFGMALRGFPETRAVAARIRGTPGSLTSRMEACSERLMEQGMLRYREGELEEAIRIWKEILLFSPGDEGARKAIETATVQLETLKSMGRRGE